MVLHLEFKMDIHKFNSITAVLNTLHAEIISTSPFINAEIKIISWRSK